MIGATKLLRALGSFFQGKTSGVFIAVRKAAKDETGLEMIEYIVMAALLVAAVVVTITYFGGTIQGMFAAIAHAVSGDSGLAKTARDAARDDADEAATTGQDRQKEWGEGNL